MVTDTVLRQAGDTKEWNYCYGKGVAVKVKMRNLNCQFSCEEARRIRVRFLSWSSRTAAATTRTFPLIPVHYFP